VSPWQTHTTEKEQKRRFVSPDSTDQHLIKTLQAYAAACNAKADAIDAKALGEDPDEE
jgi:hypothetical protein